MKVSVIIPVYNVELYIKECFESILIQTLDDIEVIIVNDGSTDRSIDLIKGMIEQNDHIKLINQKNQGLSSARNAGMRVAQGEYIYFLDSDDYLSENFLECLYNEAKKYNLDIACGCHSKVFENGEEIKIKRDKKLLGVITSGSEFLYRQLKVGDYRMEVWDDLYKRKFIEENKIEFYEGILHEDEEFTPKALIKADRVKIVENYGYKYRQRNNSIMSSNIDTKNIVSLSKIVKSLSDISNNMTSDKNERRAISKVIMHILGAFVIKSYIANIDYNDSRYKDVFDNELTKSVMYDSNIKSKLKYLMLKKCPIIYLKIIKTIWGIN